MPRWPWLTGAALLLAAAPIASYLNRAPGQHPIASPARTKTPARDVVERSAILPAIGALHGMLIAQGVSSADADAITALIAPRMTGTDPVTTSISLRLGTGAPQVLRVKAAHNDSSGVTITRDESLATGWRIDALTRKLDTQLLVTRGEMNDDSLYSSAVAAHVDESLIPDFAQAFVYDFDFQREIHPGDVFEMASEQAVNADGVAFGAPRLIYAAFTTADKSRALYRFTPISGAQGWFDGNGRSVVRSLMRTPVEGARVSSTFGWRVHPIEGFRKMHKGIDFAVPNGTPIYAAGAGSVETAHFSDSAGNMVILRHDKGMETKYFHLTSFGAGIAQGATVTQGQQIGLSGTTGHSTGPHLHYEVHLNGEPIDPTTVKTEDGITLTGDDLMAFRRERDRIDAARASHAS